MRLPQLALRVMRSRLLSEPQRTPGENRTVAIVIGFAFLVLTCARVVSEVARQCSSIPTSRDAVDADLNKAWDQKTAALKNGISTLEQVR
jgi:hypothetical protein